MLWGLLRYLDPVAHRKRAEDLRRQREDWPPDIDPSLTDESRPAQEAAARSYRCRICNRVGPEERFCPVCLAETMK